MWRSIDREAVNQFLDGEVLYLVKVIGIILLYNRDGAAGARSISPPQTGIIFDDVRSRWQWKVGDRFVTIQ